MSLPAPSQERSLAARRGAGLALLTGLLLLGCLELGPRVVAARPGDPFQAVCFAGFRNYQAHTGARLTRPGCRVRLTGLGSQANVDVRVGLARADEPAALSIEANGAAVTWRPSPGRPDERQLSARADAAGRLELRFRYAEGARPLAVTRVEARQPGLAWPPWQRLAGYALALALAGLAVAWCSSHPASVPAGVATAALLLGLGLGLARLTTLTVLPSLLLATAFGLACGRLAQRLGAQRDAARWVGAAALLRLALVIQPNFPCIDVGFHSGTLVDFMAGQPIVSRAPNPDRHAGALPMPYPPLAYALLAPLARAGVVPREALVRLALGLLEGSSALLVLLLARAGGLSGTAAGAAAATAAVVPEGLLVLAKGLLANALAAWLGLAALTAALRRRPVLAAALLAATFLAHFGHALLVLPLVAGWLCLGAWRGALARPVVLRLALALGAALAVAWLSYYREVVDLALATSAALRESWTAGPTVYGLRWIQLGKIAQDLLLKFGLLPLGLAWAGLRAAQRPSALRGLLEPWLAVGAAACLAAVLTPVPLRFEYFLVPALGLAVGLLAEWRPDSPQARRLPACWLAVFALQAALGALLLAGRFRLLSVILESTNWPFPVQL